MPLPHLLGARQAALLEPPAVRPQPFRCALPARRAGSRRPAILRPSELDSMAGLAPREHAEQAQREEAPSQRSPTHQALHAQEYSALPLDDPATLFPSAHVSRPDLLFFLYFPFGVALAGARMLLWVALLLADQPWLTDNDAAIAALQAVLGVRVRWAGTQFLPQQRHVLVSNHVTTGDLMALYRLPTRTTHLVSTGLPARVTQARHHRVDLQHASRQTYERLAAERAGPSIHLFPEGGMTSGAGMMRFSRGFLKFADGLPVAPVALRAALPWGLATHTLRSSFLQNMFWFCFSPTVTLHLTVLPPVQRMLGETKARFVERVQQQIAEELQIPVYDYTVVAKRQLVSRQQKRR